MFHSKYRPDIDGLRAVAVLSVVGFHAFPNLVKGGFVGVDIFFVISGFLISTIIFNSLKGSTFSFIEFYSRRIRRIFPALLVVMLVCFTIGALFLLPEENKQLGKHIAGGALFVSNFVLWQESGYFDNAAETKPLLHLWSLGIEEQFYIVWPFFLWLGSRLRLDFMILTALVAAISFGVSVSNYRIDPIANFYSPQTRFWELLAGSALAYLTLRGGKTQSPLTTKPAALLSASIWPDAWERHSKAIRNAQSLVGALLIVLALLFVTKDRLFPGYWALLPVSGAVLIIAAGTGAWLNRVLLSNRVLVWFGLISFPLYLWHWPLLSFSRLIEGDVSVGTIRVGVVLFSVVLAWLTFRLIEQPLRYGKASTAKTAGLLLVMTVFALVGFGIFNKQGLVPSHLAKEYAFLANYDYLKSARPDELFRDANCFMGVAGEIPDRFDDRCLNRYKSRPVVALLGDSFAYHLQSGMKPTLDENRLNFVAFSSIDCFPLVEVDYGEVKRNDGCKKRMRELIAAIESIHPDFLVVFVNYRSRLPEAQLQSLDKDLFAEAARHVKAKKIVLLGMMPTWRNGLPRSLATYVSRYEAKIPTRTDFGVEKASLDYDAALKKAFQDSPIVSYLSVSDLLCQGNKCLTFVGDNLNEDMIVWDYGHLTRSGGRYVTSHLILPELVKEGLSGEGSKHRYPEQ